MGGYNYTKLLKEHFDTQFHTQPFYITQYNVMRGLVDLTNNFIDR